MASDWSAVPALISAASGLGGVWLGGWLTGSRERRREAERMDKEASYLAVLAVAHLDRFADGCLDVARDDGTSEGEPAGRGGVHASTVTPPTFDPLALKVDWKVLPNDLMYSVLNIPYEQEQLHNRIAGVAEHDDPPEYTTTFWTRRKGYAELGLKVSAIAQRLRVQAGLPVQASESEDWTRENLLRAELKEVVDAETAWAERLLLYRRGHAAAEASERPL